MNPARILQEMGKGTAEDGLGGGVKAGAKEAAKQVAKDQAKKQIATSRRDTGPAPRPGFVL